MKKLTKEDIKKYGTKEEIKLLEMHHDGTDYVSDENDADGPFSDAKTLGIGPYLKIDISLDTDAFAENPKVELKRILSAIAKNIDRMDGINFMAIPDKNGKACGIIEYQLPE